MTVDEFKRLHKTYLKKILLRSVVFTAIALFWVGVNAPLQKRWEDSYRGRFDEDLARMLTAMPMVLPLAIAAFALIPLARRFNRTYGIPCPHCGQPLAKVPELVIASRNCPFCGGNILSSNGV
jgi:hypothetical protein